MPKPKKKTTRTRSAAASESATEIAIPGTIEPPEDYSPSATHCWDPKQGAIISRKLAAALYS